MLGLSNMDELYSSNSSFYSLSSDASNMENYGTLLTCPVCKELFTHPVLLPCQHSMCFGCARSEILVAAERSEEENARSSVTSQSSALSSRSNGKIRSESTPNKSISNGVFTSSFLPSPTRRQSQRSYSSRKMTSSPISSTSLIHNETCNVTVTDMDNVSMADSAIVLSTNDLLHFGESRERTTNGHRVGTPEQQARNKTLSRMTPPSKLNMSNSKKLIRSSSSSSLRRSTSTSSLCRSGSVRSNTSDYKSLRQSKLAKLFCPTCELDVDLGKNGISGMFRNFALEAIVERFRKAAKGAIAVRCGYCKPPAANATKSCTDCKLSYCNECFKTFHIWGTAKAQHHYTGPTNNFTRPKVLLCPEHTTEPVNMYCNKCHTSVCKKCKAGRGRHVGHPISSVKTAYIDSKKRLSGLLDVLQEKKHVMGDAINKMEDNMNALNVEEAEIRDEIHNVIDGLHSLLEKKRSELLAKADVFLKKKQSEMRKELYDLHNNVMYASVMTFAEEIMKEEDPAYFLQAVKMVESRIQAATFHLSRIPNIVSHDTKQKQIHLYVEDNEVKEQLDQLDFLQIPPSVASIENTDDNTMVWQPVPSAEYYEIKISFRNSPQQIEQTHDAKFILSNGDEREICVRAINKAGASPWSQWKEVKSGPNNCKFRIQSVDKDNDVIVSSSGHEASLQDDFAQQQLKFLTGDMGFWGGEQTWVFRIDGFSNFKVLVGVGDINCDNSTIRHSFDLEKLLKPASSALLYCEAASSSLLEYEDYRSCSSPNVSNGYTKSSSSIKSENFLSVKPLKQLKKTIFRRSSFDGRSIKSKSPLMKSKKYLEVDDLTRSYSTTALQNDDGKWRSLSPGKSKKSQTVGRMRLDIGVTLRMYGNNEAIVQFRDMTSDSNSIIFTKSLHVSPPLCPVIALSGHGKILIL